MLIEGDSQAARRCSSNDTASFAVATGISNSSAAMLMLPSARAVLAIAGSMSFEGDVIGWVAIHRRHHAFTDRPGDPHSPYRYGTSLPGQLRGLAHAHVGWLLRDDPTPAARYAPDMAADPAMRAISAAFPALCAVSLGLPSVAGWAIGGWHGALTALLWAGLVRMALLHHVTWSVNSVCHMFGRRPSATKDQSRNFAALAIVSFGESWHNFHHAHPASARHGAGKRQIDSSAWIIRQFERIGWATKVRWPAMSVTSVSGEMVASSAAPKSNGA